MTRLNNSMFMGYYPETHIAIRNIDDYLFESFNVPKNQTIPANHFEFKGYLCCGDKRSGKSWLNFLYLSYKAWEVWGDSIDFFQAEDIYALIDSVSTSEKPVHFIILDDQVSRLDSRNPMGNRTITELYFEIAHELKRRSEAMGGNLGGLVIVAILVQNYGAIDLRLRSDSMFTIFKTFDKFGCKEYNLDEEVEYVLKDWKIRSNRLTDYTARMWAFVIDINDEGCIIYFDANQPKYKELPFKFITVRGIDRYREQRNQLVKYLVKNLNIIKLSNKELKEELYEQLDILENAPEKCRITPSNFTEIISRTRKQYKKLHLEKIEELRQKQMQELVEFLYTNINMDDYQESELKGELFFLLDDLIEDREDLYISRSDFLEIIYRAKVMYRNSPIEEIESKPEKVIKIRIKELMENVKPIWSISELKLAISDVSGNILRATITNNKDMFKNVLKGNARYCLVEHKITEEEKEEVRSCKQKKKKPIKKLIMDKESKTEREIEVN